MIGKGKQLSLIHISLSCIPATAMGKSKLLITESGILAGIEVAKEVFRRFDPTMKVEVFMNDGAEVKPGDVATVSYTHLSYCFDP